MQKVKRLLAGFLILCLTGMYIPGTVQAAGGSIRFSDPSGKVGSTVKVSVRVSSSGGPIGSVKVTLQYDASALEFKGGSNASGGSGGVSLIGYGDGSTNMLNYSLSFKIIRAGSHKITVASYDAVNSSEEALNLTEGSATVTGKTEGGSDKEPEDGGDSSRSDNTRLSKLEISPGSLSPKFSPKVKSYKADVEEDVKELIISAIPEDEDADTTVEGATKLKKGQNQVTITVTAQNGVSATYTIMVNRGGKKEEEQPKSMKGLKLKIGDKVFEFSSDFKKDMIPKDFEQTTLTYNKQQVLGLKHAKSDLFLGYLVEQESKEGSFYICDIPNMQFYPFVQFEMGEGKYIIPMPFEEDWKAPEGFLESSVTIDGQKLSAFQATDNEPEEIGEVGFAEPLIVHAEGKKDEAQVKKTDFYLLYAMNEKAQSAWYLYDAKEKTFQRYMEEVDTTGVEKKAEESKKEAKETTSSTMFEKFNQFAGTLVGKCVLALLLIVIILLIILAVRYAVRRHEDDDFDEDDQDFYAISKKSAFSKSEATPEPVKKAKPFKKPEPTEPRFDEPKPVNRAKEAQQKKASPKPAPAKAGKGQKDDFEIDFIDLDDE